MTALNLASPDLIRTLLRAGLPTAGGLSINAAHQGVDSYFVGQLGQDALAAVSLALPITGLTAAIGVGLGIGTAAAAGRALGSGHRPEAVRLASSAMMLCLLLAALASATLWLAQRPMLDALGATGSVREPAQQYLRILTLSAGLGMVQILCDFTAIGSGHARFSLFSLMLCFSLNMALDPLLIFTAGLGVQGAALATVLAQICTLVLYGWYFTASRTALRLRPRLSASAFARLWPVLRIGLPEAASVLLASLAFLLLYRLAGKYEGAAGQAAMGIALRLWVLATLPVEGFCLGAQAVLAHAAGAGNLTRLARAALTTATIAAAAAGLFLVTGLNAAPQISALFTADPTVQSLAAPALAALAVSLPATALRHAAQVSLQASSRARDAALLGLAPLGWLFLPLLFAAASLWGFAGLAPALSLAALVTGIAAVLILRHLPHAPLKGLPT